MDASNDLHFAAHGLFWKSSEVWDHIWEIANELSEESHSLIWLSGCDLSEEDRAQVPSDPPTLLDVKSREVMRYNFRRAVLESPQVSRSDSPLSGYCPLCGDVSEMLTSDEGCYMLVEGRETYRHPMNRSLYARASVSAKRTEAWKKCRKLREIRCGRSEALREKDVVIVKAGNGQVWYGIIEEIRAGVKSHYVLLWWFYDAREVPGGSGRVNEVLMSNHLDIVDVEAIEGKLQASKCKKKGIKSIAICEQLYCVSKKKKEKKEQKTTGVLHRPHELLM